MENIGNEQVVRCIGIGETLYACINDDVPVLHDEYDGIYINEEKPWFHGRKCTIKSQCVAHWNEPITDEECEEWKTNGAPESLIYHKEYVACSDEHLYMKVDE